MEKPFCWNKRELPSIGDIWDEAIHIMDNLDDPVIGAEFIDDYGAYLEECNESIDGRWVAQQNLGYMAGYYDRELRERVYEFYEIEHPFFGTSNPTPEEAFELGKKWGEAIKRGESFPLMDDEGDKSESS